MFLVRKGETEGRLDPAFYKPSTLRFIEKLKTSKFEVRRLKTLAKRVVDGPFGTQLKVEDYREIGVPVLRVSNVSQGEISGDKLVRISPEKHKQLYRSRVLPNDVLLTKAGAILGYSAVFPEHLVEGNITSHLVTISCRDEIKPHYLKIVFQSSIGQVQIYRWGNKSTRPELNTDEVKKIFIPIAPITVQKAIIGKSREAETVKRAKEREAKALLESIDIYLLERLGLRKPEAAVLTTTFFTRSSLISNGRLDPYYFQREFQTMVDIINGGSYPVVELKAISTKIISGRTPASHAYSDVTTDYPIIKAGSYTGDYVDLEKIGYTKSKVNSLAVRKGDIFILAAAHQAEYVGKKIVLLDSNPNSATGFVGELICLRVNEKVCNPQYLFALLNIPFVKRLLNREKRGQTSHLYPNDIKHLRLPMPPLQVQLEIARDIKSVRESAESLFRDAKAELIRTRAQIEKVLLGESTDLFDN